MQSHNIFLGIKSILDNNKPLTCFKVRKIDFIIILKSFDLENNRTISYCQEDTHVTKIISCITFLWIQTFLTFVYSLLIFQHDCSLYTFKLLNGYLSLGPAELLQISDSSPYNLLGLLPVFSKYKDWVPGALLDIYQESSKNCYY